MKPYYFVLSLFVLTLIGCDSDTEALYPDPFHPDQEQFRSSLFIEVINATGNPVANTLIRIGNYKRETDNRGFLYLKDVLVGASTYLTAEKEGYFHASRRFYPTAGSSQYIRLVMLSDARDAFFSSGNGGILPVDGGVTIHFPKDGYEYLNGASYDGVVTVSAKVIAADDPDLSYKMPGDLTGVDVNGDPGSLASLGMVAVELKSSQGSRLRLKEGIQVQIDMTVPAANLDNASSTIPMWYFDEEEGIWKEEGSATLSGNVYTANVSHFSYWNYDAWFPAIKWGATFDFGNRGLASELEVCITIISMNTTKCAYTNSEGMVCGLVAANELLLMEVSNSCGDVIYSQEIGPFSDSTMLGPITLSDPGMVITNVSGLAVTCDGSPVTNGFATISIGDFVQHTALDEISGAFSVSACTCGEGDVKVTVVDVEHNKLSLPLSFHYAPVLDADTIVVCENNQELIDLQVIGFPDHFYYYFPAVHLSEGATIIYVPDSLGTNDYFNIGVEGKDAGIYTPFLAEVRVTLSNGDKVYLHEENVIVTITQYGGVGDYITGTMSGTWFPDAGASGGTQYPLVGSFSVLREK